MKQEKLKIVSEKLSEILDYRDITNAELAKIIGRSATTIANWLNGIGEPNFEDILLISLNVDVKIGYFFDETISVEDADQRLTGEKRAEVLKFFRRLLFKEVSPADSVKYQLETEILNLPEDIIPYVLSLVKTFQGVIVD